MDTPKIYNMANCKISKTYGSTSVPDTGSVIVTDNNQRYEVFFEKVSEEYDPNGWIPLNVVEIEK